LALKRLEPVAERINYFSVFLERFSKLSVACFNCFLNVSVSLSWPMSETALKPRHNPKNPIFIFSLMKRSRHRAAQKLTTTKISGR